MRQTQSENLLWAEERQTDSPPAPKPQDIYLEEAGWDEEPPKRPGMLARLREKWAGRPRLQDPGQRRAGGNILRFLAAVLVLTLVARGTAGATLAAVDTTHLESAESEEGVRGNATVQTAGEVPLEAPEGLTVKEMLVTAGQKVAEGEGIARFDESELTELLAREQADLQKLKAQQQKLSRAPDAGTAETPTAQQGADWAQQDVTGAQAEGDRKVAAAQQTLEDAKAALKAAQKAVDKLPEDADKETVAAAKQALAEAEAAVPAAEQALEEARQAAQSGLQQAQRDAEKARQGLETARKNDAKAQQDAADTRAENQAESSSVALDIEKKQKRIDELTALLAAGGVLAAPVGGLVLAGAEAGGKTQEGTPLVRLTDDSRGFEAEAFLDKSDTQDLAPGIECDVTPQGSSMYYRESLTGTLLALSDPDENGKVKATIRLPEGAEWKQGQTVDIRFVKSRESYQSCVPVSALHSDNGGYYLLVMQQTSGVLGTENVVQRIPVNLVAQDSNNAAVEAPLSPEDRIITGSSKPIEAGDNVREREA